MREEKLELLQNGILHISKIWEANGHNKWTWVLPRFTKIEQEFDELSTDELRSHLREIYRRLSKEKVTQ